jgi:hypothetical protein
MKKKKKKKKSNHKYDKMTKVKKQCERIADMDSCTFGICLNVTFGATLPENSKYTDNQLQNK